MERVEVLQQKLEHWCAASVRALAAEPTVEFRGHHLMVNEEPIVLQAPHLHLDFKTHDSRKLRGVADGIALRLCYSDRALHKQLCPEDSLELLVFELLEQLRCESLAPRALPGIATNLRNRFLFWAGQAGTSKLIENDVGILLFSLTIVCWSRLLGVPIPEQIEDTIEHTRWGFADSIGPHLRMLKLNREDQLSFSKSALEVAKVISKMVGNNDGEETDDLLDETIRTLANSKTLNLTWLDSDNAGLEQNYSVSRAEEISLIREDYHYRVFSKAHDVELKAAKIIRAAQLRKLREQLDKRIRQQSVNTHRVARHLKQLVASPALSGWSFGEEEGYLDSARLARLITSPDDRRLFRKEQNRPASNCVVSIVIDNSGSMTHHNTEIAALVDTLAKALELAEIKTEILGFTTREWNGGKVANEWNKAGKPKNPGRLNALCHTVYKAAETPWRRSRQAISGMLKSDLFREGVDGEALQWAVKRIENRPENKKIILMLSDGSPMDTATHAANSDRYLDQHLAQVAIEVEARPDINLCALGVGLDLSTYYRESMSISLSNELTTNDFFAIADLLNRAV